MSFNLDNYEPVADRLARFWKDHPAGRVLTEMVSRAESVVTFRATVWFDKTEADPTATGWASEVEGSRGVNQTSAVENCETSAIGRALANCNYAPKAHRPSREEMAKAERGRPEPDPAEEQVLFDAYADEIRKAKDHAAIEKIGASVKTALARGDLTKAGHDRLGVLAGARAGEINGKAQEVAGAEQPALP